MELCIKFIYKLSRNLDDFVLTPSPLSPPFKKGLLDEESFSLGSLMSNSVHVQVLASKAMPKLEVQQVFMINSQVFSSALVEFN